MLFMAIVSTGSAESIAVSSLVAYDIYREYINPKATGEQILFVSRVVIVLFGLFMGVFSIILNEIGLNLGWVYLFMGICIGSAVVPLWNMMTWKDANATGAILGAWCGLVGAVVVWFIAASIQSGEISIATHLFGSDGSMMIAIMLFMAIVSTGSAESIAVSSLVAYDIYRQYIKPDATGADILYVSRVTICVWGLGMG